jgi:RNase P/RNase MRP subunit p29
LRNIGIWGDVVDHTQPMLEIKVTDGAQARDHPMDAAF